MAPPGLLYKIKLSSGRVLGPLDLGRIRALILKNHVVGTELAREHPVGEWQDINLFAPIAELLVSHAKGTLMIDSTLPEGQQGTEILAGPTQVLPGAPDVGNNATVVLPGSASLIPLPELPSSSSLSAELPSAHTAPIIDSEPSLDGLAAQKAVELHSEEAATQMMTPEQEPESLGLQDLESTRVLEPTGTLVQGTRGLQPRDVSIELDFNGAGPRNIAHEQTVVFQRSGAGAKKKAKVAASPKRQSIIRAAVITAAILAIGFDFFFPDPGTSAQVQVEPIRPKLPALLEGKADPAQSLKLYQEAMKFYLQDTVPGYRAAAARLHKAASLDATNVKAFAMLASCYLNLIDSSNKDENYFSVISKLIELSRAKAADLPETIIADVEFFVTINKAEAAQSRIVEYTRVNQTFGLEMFFYLAYSFYHRGDAQNAARYIAQIPDNKAFSARIFYLRGQVAEKLGDTEAALQEYEKAVKFNPNHARSRLQIAAILHRGGKIREAAAHLEFLIRRTSLLAPKELAQAYYLHAQFSQVHQKYDVALGDIERAVRLHKNNPDYLLELYTLRAKAGASIQSIQKDARMYFFLSEGEKLLKEGKYQDALTQFLQARQSNFDSPLPLVKIGDMFQYLNDVGNARENYKVAAQKAPRNIDIWSKYINSLILSYEWEEAEKAMAKFRVLPVSQSAIDKAAGDIYARQNRHIEAQAFYRKAMARDSIDSDVYIAYAKSLMATKNFKDAPFFFSLALRFDPLNIDALVGTAKCVAASEGIDRAIIMLQDELQKGSGARAELLSAIAELQIQKGEWEGAQQNVNQAMQANPDYAYPWRLQAQIYMNREGAERNALDKALDAYKSYSDRNTSDPSGYLERYRVFIKKAQFEQANEELARIYTLYPKYPNLHYYKGTLYGIMGNHKAAVEEFTHELKNNTQNVPAMLALGKEYLELDNANDALKHFNLAMQLAPQSAEPKHLSAYANFLLKNYAGAIALYNAALVYDKGNPLIYKRLGMAYRAMGDAAGASKAFRQYLEMEPDAADKAEFERFL